MKNIIKRILSLSIVICFLFNTASPAFAVSAVDVLRSMIKQIERVEIMDDEAVLDIGNDIERANEIYKALSSVDKESIPSSESSLLIAYVNRIAEILSMGKLQSTNSRAYTGNTYTKNGVAYYEHDGFYAKGPVGSSNVYLGGKMYIRTSHTTDICKSTNCVLPEHSNIHNKNITNPYGLLVWSTHSTPLIELQWNTSIYEPNNHLSMLLTQQEDDVDYFATVSGRAYYGETSVYFDRYTAEKQSIRNLTIENFPMSQQIAVMGDVNKFLEDGGHFELTAWTLGFPYTAKVIIAKDSGIFDNTPPSQPTVTAKPVARYYVAPMELEDNTQNGVEFLGYSTHEEIEQEKIDRVERKVLSANTFEHDVLYKLIKNISRNDINDDAVVLSIGNEIERAFEIYSSLSASEQELFPAEEKEILLRYVNRMSEILSMNKLRSPNPRAVSDLPDTLLKDGILYYKMPTTFMYKKKDSSTDTWTRNIPLNIVAYSRFNDTVVCSSLTCNDTTHGHGNTTTHSSGLYPNNSSTTFAFSCYINGIDSNPTTLIKTGDWGDDWSSPSSDWSSYANANYVLNDVTYPVAGNTTVGKSKFISAGSSGWSGVALLGDLQELFNMGGLMKVSSTFNTSYYGNRGTTRVIFGVETAFDTSPPTVPTISLTEKLKQVLSATLDWFSSDVEITIDGSTDTGGSGLKGYEYQIDGGAWQAYTAPFTVNATCTVNARAVDNANNRSTNATKQIKIDKVAPSAPTLTKLPNTTFANRDVTVTIAHGIDSQSGVARTEYQIDSEAWQTYTAPIVVSSTSSVKARTIDNVGLISPVSSTNVKIDKLAPSAPIIIKSPVGEFVNSNVTITINGSTDTGGSALKGYEYQLNSGAWQAYTASLTITATTSINARAVDNALNYSSISNAQVKIDRVAPSAPAIIKSPTREYANDDITVVITSGIDDYSGVKRTEYQMNGGSWQTYTAPLVISSNTTIKARTIDNANNISIEVSEEIKIDRVAPSAPVIIKSPVSEFANDDVTITINGSTDIGGSGIKDYEYQLDGGTWQAYTVPLTITSTSSINARVIDNALNYSSLSTEEVKIDRTSPIVHIEKTPDDWTNGSVTISIQAEDDGSGLKSFSMTSPSSISIDMGENFITTTSASFVVDKNAIYNFIIENHAGLQVKFNSTVDKIEDLPPTPPKVDESGEGTPPTDPTVPDHIEKDWSNVPIELPVTSDAPSGIKKFQYIIEENNPSPLRLARRALTQAWIDYEGAVFKVEAEGTYTLRVRSVSNAGNISDVSTYLIRNDYTAPTATHEFKDNKTILNANDGLSGIAKISCTHGDITGGSTTSCDVVAGTVHDYMIYDTAGNMLGYSTKSVIVPPAPPSNGDGGGGDDDYEYPNTSTTSSKPEEPKKEMPIKLAPSKPTITGNEKPNSANESGGEIITSTNDEKNAQIKPPIANEVTPDSTEDNNTVKRAGGISWCIWIFIILILIALVVLIREIFYNKEGEDENNVW